MKVKRYLQEGRVKIQFVERKNGKVIERGNIVEVMSTECGWYRIADGMGDDMLVPPSVVEVVEPLPEPPETKPLGIESDEEFRTYLAREYGA